MNQTEEAAAIVEWLLAGRELRAAMWAKEWPLAAMERYNAATAELTRLALESIERFGLPPDAGGRSPRNERRLK